MHQVVKNSEDFTFNQSFKLNESIYSYLKSLRVSSPAVWEVEISEFPGVDLHRIEFNRAHLKCTVFGYAMQFLKDELSLDLSKSIKEGLGQNFTEDTATAMAYASLSLISIGKFVMISRQEANAWSTSLENYQKFLNDIVESLRHEERGKKALNYGFYKFCCELDTFTYERFVPKTDLSATADALTPLGPSAILHKKQTFIDASLYSNFSSDPLLNLHDIIHAQTLLLAPSLYGAFGALKINELSPEFHFIDGSINKNRPQLSHGTFFNEILRQLMHEASNCDNIKSKVQKVSSEFTKYLLGIRTVIGFRDKVEYGLQDPIKPEQLALLCLFSNLEVPTAQVQPQYLFKVTLSRYEGGKEYNFLQNLSAFESLIEIGKLSGKTTHLEERPIIRDWARYLSYGQVAMQLLTTANFKDSIYLKNIYKWLSFSDITNGIRVPLFKTTYERFNIRGVEKTTQDALRFIQFFEKLSGSNDLVDL